MNEVGYFRQIDGAHLGNPNILLLECGHEVEEPEPVGAGVRLCLACGRGEPSINVTDEYWEAWVEQKHRQEQQP